MQGIYELWIWDEILWNLLSNWANSISMEDHWILLSDICLVFVVVIWFEGSVLRASDFRKHKQSIKIVYVSHFQSCQSKVGIQTFGKYVIESSSTISSAIFCQLSLLRQIQSNCNSSIEKNVSLRQLDQSCIHVRE